MRPFHVGAIEDLIHPVDYGLLESSAMTFSASLLSADAEDPSRSGYPSGAVLSSPEALDHNSVILDYHRRAFAR
jgi:hypothetical protein